MATIGVTASIQRACNSQHITKKQPPQTRPARLKQATNVVTPNLDGLKLADNQEKSTFLTTETPRGARDEIDHWNDAESLYPRFSDERWKNGTWDLNMFVKHGRMDWDTMITSEARRRKYLEKHPEAATHEEQVLFRSSVIPWWAWIKHSHLPEAEVLNGRAAMVGFFMSYIVDALTGLDVVGQAGNFICKAALFLTIIGVILFRKTQDFENIQKLAEEATFYDKQWQASWQNHDDPKR
ncbi:unnamed protein product [Fraxinus pennsylvanica]|uniref:Uncharacterized protein n=1 Tax=Fraxinus pennsylvanica TaxID=56036 RepID=A0AAD2E2N1_9LAMI|nr:unnamed protein product [Fraxinus pennsylvanica]